MPPSISRCGALLFEKTQIDRIAHRLVARIVRVQMIARIVSRIELIRVRGIARHLRKINRRVEGAAVADPVVHRFPHLFALGRVIFAPPYGVSVAPYTLMPC